LGIGFNGLLCFPSLSLLMPAFHIVTCERPQAAVHAALRHHAADDPGEAGVAEEGALTPRAVKYPQQEIGDQHRRNQNGKSRDDAALVSRTKRGHRGHDRQPYGNERNHTQQAYQAESPVTPPGAFVLFLHGRATPVSFCACA